MLEFLSSVPAVLWYLITLLAVVLIWFLALKRPVYEAVLVAFLVLVTISGTWGQFPLFVKEALSEKMDRWVYLNDLNDRINAQ